eukprot:scaffold16707_cov157-Isochrysis_galbana.AAC.1
MPVRRVAVRAADALGRHATLGRCELMRGLSTGVSPQLAVEETAVVDAVTSKVTHGHTVWWYAHGNVSGVKTSSTDTSTLQEKRANDLKVKAKTRIEQCA